MAAVQKLERAARFLQVWNSTAPEGALRIGDPYQVWSNQPKAPTSALLQAVLGDSEVTNRLHRLLCRADRKRLQQLHGPFNELGVPRWVQDLAPPKPTVRELHHDAKPLEVL